MSWISLVYTFGCMKNPFSFCPNQIQQKRKNDCFWLPKVKGEFGWFIYLRKPTNKFSPLLIPMTVGKLRYGFHLTNAILTRHCPLRRGQNSIFFIKTFRKLNIIFQKPVHYGLIYTHRISRVWQNLFFQLLVRDARV